jgi:hypothetical protein
MQIDPKFRPKATAVVTPEVPHFRLIVLLGLVAAIVAVTAIVHNDRVSAAWASLALLGVAGWIVLPLLRGLQGR